MSEVQKLFGEILAAVGEIAPQSVTNFNPPANAPALAQLKQQIPDVPVALLELLAMHDGEEAIAWLSVFPNGMQLMSIDSILERHAYTRSVKLEYLDIERLAAQGIMNRPIGPVKPAFSSSLKVPLAQFNGDILWLLDLDPAAGGSVGQVVEEDAEGMALGVIAPSLEDLMKLYLRDLAAGRFEASEQDGQILSLTARWPDIAGLSAMRSLD